MGVARVVVVAGAVTPDALEDLGRKYREMLAMRLDHDAGLESEVRVRARMAELALRFPGALREIDDLELESIHDRISRIDAALSGDIAVERWMEAVALFHGLARGALWAKRWLAGRKVVDPATMREYALHAAGDLAARSALEWTDDLGLIALPPRGRLMDLVFARIGRVLGVTDPEARRLVFGRRLAQQPIPSNDG